LSIDFLAIGHITHDLVSDGFRLGGTVTFAAVTALRLGRNPAIVTRASPELLLVGRDGFAEGAPDSALRGIPVRLAPSAVSTTFTNTYHDGQRTQFVAAVADPITPDVLPHEWSSSPIVLLGPIARETPPNWLRSFPSALLGMTPQGMMRQWDERGRVSFGGWTGR
jgi:1D-myo-inositol 3-kinase